MAAEGYLGSGDLYLAIEEDGEIGPLQGPFFINKFEIQVAATVRENKSKGKTTYGQVLASVALAEPAAFTIEMKQLDKLGLVVGLAGEATVVSQAAGTLTDEAVTVVADHWVSVSKKRFTSVTVENTAGTTTYVEGTDYEFNKDLGMIKALSTGAISNAASVNVSGAFGLIAATRVQGGKKAQIRARFIFDGKNFVTGKPFQAEIYQGVVAAQAALDFLADDFTVLPLTGRMETPVGKDSPFEVTTY